MIHPPKPQGLVMARASCNLFCGILFMSFGIIQRQDALEFMTYGRKFNFNLIWAKTWENLSSETCEQPRPKQVFHVRAHYFSYPVREQQRHWSDCARVFVGHIMEYIIQFLSSRRCSLHYQKKQKKKKQPRHSFLITCINTNSRILWTLHSFD